MDHVSEEIDIVIVGGGICGLATALALHRKGIESVVLERSEALRATGGGIGIQANGWRALDELGVASKLRNTSILVQRVRDVMLNKGKQQEAITSFSNIGEVRCLKRSDIIEALAEYLPLGTIRFGCQILDVKLDKLNSLPILELKDGSRIRAKVLIGCDGANSVVADFLHLKPKKFFSSRTVRGFTNFPNGHGLAPEFVRTRRGNTLSGVVPVTDKLVFWFVGHQWHPLDSNVGKDPKLIRQMTLETINGSFPNEKIEMVKNCDLNTLSFTHLIYRAPWDILLGNFRKGTVTVAGDAMHVMGPFLGQGGSAGIEDAIVLGRFLAKVKDDLKGIGTQHMVEKIGKVMDAYAKERRMRLVRLSTQSYLIGSLLDTSSLLVKFVIIVFLVVLFRNQFGHARYNCGRL